MSPRPRAFAAAASVGLAFLLIGPAVSSAQAEPFGFASFSNTLINRDGTADTQAGSHPWEMVTSGEFTGTGGGEQSVREVQLDLPVGLVGNPTAVPQCTIRQFTTELSQEERHHLPPESSLGLTHSSCPDNSQLGTAELQFTPPGSSENYVFGLYNLVPPPGVPAEFGANIVGIPVLFQASVRSDTDNGLSVKVVNVPQALFFYGFKVTVWGVPADPSHDGLRGACLGAVGQSVGSCPSGVSSPKPFLTMPVSCPASPPLSRFRMTSWQHPEDVVEATPAGNPDSEGNPARLDGCNQAPYSPSTSAQPTTTSAYSATGLNFTLHNPQSGLLSPTAVAESQLAKATVTLPEGMSLNPSAGAGLTGCTEADLAREGLQTPAGAGCPNSAKVGDVSVHTPLLPEPLPGSLYVAEPFKNRFDSLLAIYLIVKDPLQGVLLKLAGVVHPDPVTGQLTTTFENLPQLPFSDFTLSFSQGQTSPLITPPTCGPYIVAAQLVPHANPATLANSTSAFSITSGVGGGACPPAGTPPFHPGLTAGTVNNNAGSYSPFYAGLSRNDGEQELTHFSIKLPPGLTGKLAGIPYCSDAAIAAAKAPGRTGAEEEADPSCPKASEVGHTLVEAGVGAVLAQAPGKVYLAGPYHGSNLSLVSITAAKVGPFDLGTVVVRFALKLDPETAEVSVDGATSDPIPHIIDGIPVHLRNIRTYVDRPEFVLNPTSCALTSIASTVLGSGLDFASSADDQPVTVSSPFQAASCASLGFKPKLALSLKGGTKRGATPAFKAVLAARPGDANIGAAQVTLPHSEFLEQAHIGTVCTRVQFKEGTVPGEKCPAASIYGKARATTPILSEALEGPVYLRSSSHKLPDLVAALNNKQVNIDLDGHIDSVEGGRIRNTFEAVPDAPVTKFTLEMQGGKKGLLVNSTDLCRQKNHAISDLTGQNGKAYDTNPVLQAPCGGKKGKKKSPKKSK